MDRLLRARLHPLPRPRLLARFGAKDAAPVTVLRAAGGFGKSMLLVDWTRASLEPVAALMVAPSNSARLAFWRALQLAVSDTSGLAPVLEPAGAHLDQAESEGESVEWVLQQISRAGVFRMAIDNFDRLVDPEQVAADFQRLLELTPALRVVISTRTPVRFERAKERMRLDVAVLDADDLRFTPQELEEALAKAGVLGGVELVVARATDRIPELVIFSALELADQTDLTDADAVGAWLTQRLDAYLLDTLPAVGDRIDEICAADMLDDALAAALGGDASELRLSELERAGYGVRERRVLTGESSIFVFLAPIRRALRARAWRRNPEGFQRARALFARWARERSLHLEALAAAIDAKDYELASSVVGDFWFELGGNRAEVAEILGGLPRRVLTTWPLLAVELALTYLPLPDHQWKAAEYFTIALAGIASRKGGTSPVERLTFVLLEMVATRTLLGSYRRSNQLAERLRRTIEEFPASDLENAQRLIPRAITQIAATQMFSGNEQAALMTLLSGTVTAEPDEGPSRQQYFALALRAGAHARAGELPDAERFVRLSDSIVGEEHRHNDYSGSMARMAEAIVASERGMYQQSLDIMARLHSHYGTIENVHLLIEAETWAYLSVDPAKGLAWADTTKRTAQRQRRMPNYASASLERSMVRAALAAGEIAIAAQHLKEATAIGATPHATLAAQVELARGSHERALALLLRHPPRSDLGVRDALEHDLALVIASARNGQTSTALARLRSAASTLDARGLSLPLLAFVGNGLTELRELAEQAGLEGFGETVAPLRSGDRRARTLPRLTPREHAVLMQLLEGGTYADIASKLVVSINTVRTQVRSLYKKLDVTNREDALKVALELHLYDEFESKNPSIPRD